MNPGDLLSKRCVFVVACCFVCGKKLTVGTFDNLASAKQCLRDVYDWSFGRDSLWRCKRCRPRRFGEKS